MGKKQSVNNKKYTIVLLERNRLLTLQKFKIGISDSMTTAFGIRMKYQGGSINVHVHLKDSIGKPIPLGNAAIPGTREIIAGALIFTSIDNFPPKKQFEEKSLIIEKIYNTFGFIPRDDSSVRNDNTSSGMKILRSEQKVNHTSEKGLKNRTFLQKIFDFFRKKPKYKKCQSPKRCFTSNGRLLKPGDKLKAEIYVLSKEDIFDVGAKLTIMRNELNQYRAEREEYIKETNKRIARIERDQKETNKQTTLSYEKELNIYKEQIHKLLEVITKLKNNSQKHLIDMYTPIAKKLISDNLDKNGIKSSSP